MTSEQSNHKAERTSVTEKSIVEIYKIYVNSAEQNIDRRADTNRFFQTVLATIVGVSVFLVTEFGSSEDIVSSIIGVPTALISVLMIVLGWSWSSQLQNHSDLSSLKYLVIHEMEARLPVAPFWQELQYSNEAGKKFDMVKREQFIPRFFMLMGFMFFVASTAFLFASRN